MTDDATRLVRDARAFLGELAADNRREWFEEGKARYLAELKGPAEALLFRLTPALSEVAGHPVATKLFRPQRDVRFSKDKAPYHHHLHMAWTVPAGGSEGPAFFFGIDADAVTAGIGIFGFDPPALAAWRDLVGTDGARVSGVVAAAEAAGLALAEPDLKRVPAPYPADHPHAALLRRKGLTLSRDLGMADGVEARLVDAFRAGGAVIRLLAEVAGVRSPPP